MKKNDWILLGIIVVVSVMIFGMRFLLKDQGKAYVTVRVQGEVEATYELSEDKVIELNHGTNVIEIKNGKVDMTKADCPDQLCVHQKAISSDHETIVCLPNRVVVQITSYDEAEYDAVAN